MGRKRRKQGGSMGRDLVFLGGARRDRRPALVAKISLVTERPVLSGRLVVKRPKKRRRALVTNHALRKARGLIGSGQKWYCLKDKWVVLKDGDHRCDGCNDWFTFGEEVRKQVIAGPGEFFTRITCSRCNDGVQDTDWEKLFGEEKERVGPSLEDACRDAFGGGEIPF